MEKDTRRNINGAVLWNYAQFLVCVVYFSIFSKFSAKSMINVIIRKNDLKDVFDTFLYTPFKHENRN